MTGEEGGWGAVAGAFPFSPYAGSCIIPVYRENSFFEDGT